MQRRRLGRSGLVLPVIGLGTWLTFDVQGPEAEGQCRAVVDAAIECGSAFFDTSPMYGPAERILGMSLQRQREQVQVATKVWATTDQEADAQIDRALGYFGDWLDLYQIHNLVAWPARLNRLERLLGEGRTKAIGVTHGDPAAFAEIARIMRSGRITSIQVPYNVLDRAVEQHILPLAEELDIGVVAMMPFGHRALVSHAPPPDRLEPLAPFGVRTWAQALLKWVVSDTRISAAIPATRDPEHARENAAAGDPPWFGPAEREYVICLAERVPGSRLRRVRHALPRPLLRALRPAWHGLRRLRRTHDPRRS